MDDNVQELITRVKELEQKVDTLSSLVTSLQDKVNRTNTLSGLLDVQITDLTFEDLLQYSSDGKWHNIKVSSLDIVDDRPIQGAAALSDLSDVSISSPSNGQALVYSSSSKKWSNVTLETGGGGGGSIDLSDYLTKSEAKITYFPFSGGTITGDVTMNKNLLVQGGITCYGS